MSNWNVKNYNLFIVNGSSIIDGVWSAINKVYYSP